MGSRDSQHSAAAFGHVSAGGFLCGEGLCNLYHAVATMRGVTASPLSPQAIAGEAGANDLATETLDLFSFLGKCCGKPGADFCRLRRCLHGRWKFCGKLARIKCIAFSRRLSAKDGSWAYLKRFLTPAGCRHPGGGRLRATFTPADGKKRATD